MDFVIIKFLHVASAGIVMGGVAFALWALMPSMGGIDPEAAEKLMGGVIPRFGRMIWIVIALLVLTGIWMLVVVTGAGVPRPLYHSILGIKVILALGIFFIAFGVLAPVKALESMRQNRKRWMVINIHLIAIVFFLGVWLGRI